jgi:hypothetical protein
MAAETCLVQLYAVKGTQPLAEQRLRAPAPFAFTQVLQGEYRLCVLVDSDGNGRYTPGRKRPFQPAERRFKLPTMVTVRSQWEMEGVVL